MEKYEKIGASGDAFKDACEYLKKSPKLLPGVKGLEPDFAKDLIARYKIMTVVKAINKIMKFKPNYRQGNNQNKWYLWYWIKADNKRPAGFGFGHVGTHYDYSATSVGPRLSVGTEPAALHIDKHCRNLYLDMLL